MQSWQGGHRVWVILFFTFVGSWLAFGVLGQFLLSKNLAFYIGTCRRTASLAKNCRCFTEKVVWTLKGRVAGTDKHVLATGQKLQALVEVSLDADNTGSALEA